MQEAQCVADASAPRHAVRGALRATMAHAYASAWPRHGVRGALRATIEARLSVSLTGLTPPRCAWRALRYDDGKRMHLPDPARVRGECFAL